MFSFPTCYLQVVLSILFLFLSCQVRCTLVPRCTERLEILKEFENGIKKNRTFNPNIHIYNQELKKLDNIEKKYLDIEGKANEEYEECQDFISKRGSSTESDETFFKNLSGSKNFHNFNLKCKNKKKKAFYYC